MSAFRTAPVQFPASPKTAHALWLCLLLVAAWAHSPQVNPNRAAGYQQPSWVPAAVSTSKADKPGVEREAPFADGDDDASWQGWLDFAVGGSSNYSAQVPARASRDAIYSQPPIRAPPQAMV